MPRRLTEEEKKNKEKLIVDTATQMFDEQPYVAVTMSDLAKRCNMAKGSLFRYYATKETIFSKILYNEYAVWAKGEMKALSHIDKFTKESYRAFIKEQTHVVVAQRDRLVRLVSIKRAILDKNVAIEVLAEEVEGLRNSIRGIAKMTVQRMDFMTEEDVFKFYEVRHIAVVGAYNLSLSDANKGALSQLGKVIDWDVEIEETVWFLTENYLRSIIHDCRK